MIAGAAIRTVAPAALPVSLAELKAQCRYFETDEDAIMMAYLRSAVEHVENITSLGLITQTWTQTFSSFPTAPFGSLVLTPGLRAAPLKLFRRPVQEILFVDYLDSAGNSQPLGATVFRAGGLAQPYFPATISINTGQAWPTTYVADEAVTVTYRVGFGDDQNAVPEQIRDAILLIASTKFAYREQYVTGTTVAELPMNAVAMLRDYRPIAVV